MNNAKKSDETPAIRLGISACLLGEAVRFNGGHVRNDFLINGLGRYVEWVSVCPEVEVGMGVPRESLRLIGTVEDPRLVAQKSQKDWTDEMKGWSADRTEELRSLDLHGFVLKKDSPSCGLFRVRVYDKNNIPARNGRGIFARALSDALPILPVEEEGRLNDPRLRENFIDRIFAYYRWLKLVRENPTPKGLVDFHAAHKMTLMAHHPQAQKELGRIVAAAGKGPIDDVMGEYGSSFMNAMSYQATNRKNANVLHHLMGFLKKEIGPDDKAELLELIEEYRQGRLPLVVPLTLLQHHLRRNAVPEWVVQQTYLNPYPKELMLRNHV